jgi:hypothetical protein
VKEKLGKVGGKSIWYAGEKPHSNPKIPIVVHKRGLAGREKNIISSQSRNKQVPQEGKWKKMKERMSFWGKSHCGNKLSSNPISPLSRPKVPPFYSIRGWIDEVLDYMCNHPYFLPSPRPS